MLAGLADSTMGDNHTAIGVLLFAGTAAFLGGKYARRSKQQPLGWWGWIGLAIILAAEFLLILRIPLVTTFFTAIVWTGYVLLIDASVVSLQGSSRLTRLPREFLALVFWSVPLWLVFEGYNLRLANWDYVGMPDSILEQCIGGVWAFATIWPAIFETGDFIGSLGFFRGRGRRRAPLGASVWAALLVLGLTLVTAPVLLPVRWGRNLFGAVWLGFIPLLDCLNYRWGGQSLLAGWEAGDNRRAASLLASGAVCGILWEFWNYWAGARWVYVFPIFQHWKIFEMPLPGFFGFPPFALECFVMYEFLRTMRRRLFGARREVIAAGSSEAAS